jgi:DNA-binding Lrp family transcriptional regulator
MGWEEFRVLREILRDRSLWSGSLDPQASGQALAMRSGQSRTAVWKTLTRWKREGFLGTVHVMPNPGLFDSLIGAGRVDVPDLRSKQKLIRNLSLETGVVGVTDFVGPSVQVNVVGPTIDSFGRWRRLFETRSSISRSYGFEPYAVPGCTAKVTSLDWRLIREFTTPGGSDLSEISRLLRISPRTVARRRERLLAARAIWFVPDLDFSKLRGCTLAMFNVVPKPHVSPQAIAREVQTNFPDWVELSDDSGFTVDSKAPMRTLFVSIPFESAAAAEEAQFELVNLPGVSEVELLLPRQTMFLGTWFTEQALIAARRKSVGRS